MERTLVKKSNMNILVDKIYVCHWSKLTERKKHIKDQLDKLKFEYEFVELFDTDTWDIDEISKKYKSIFSIQLSKSQNKNSIISLALKHCWIIEDAINKGFNSIMILEDDAVLVDGFEEKFNSYYRQLPLDWDMCFVGSCCGLRSNNMRKDMLVYKANSSRCTHCYLISCSGLNKLKNEMLKIDNAIDWYYNKLIESIPLNNYWMDPALSFQSEEFQTSLGSWK